MSKGHGAAACLLQVLILPLFLAEEGQKTEIFGVVQCLNNYGGQILSWVNCTWRPNGHIGQGPFYLHFHNPSMTKKDLICSLPAPVGVPAESSCSVTTEQEFTLNDIYRVSLQDTTSGKNVTVISMYKPRLHIKSDPPSGLQSNMSTSKCRLQWNKPEAYDLIEEDFQWELAFKATTALWEQAQTRNFSSKETWIELEGFEFEPEVNYVARLRCKISEQSNYGSEWSDWSTPTEWTAPPGPSTQRPAILPSWPLFVFIPLCLGAILFLLLGLQVFSRKKEGNHGCMHIPTPATFFQPLYISHNGNFKRWVGLKEAGGWLTTGYGSHRNKRAGAASVGCQTQEAISPVSIFQQLPEAEVVSQEMVLLPLPAPSDWPYVGSKYVVLGGEEQVPPAWYEVEVKLFSSGGSLEPQGPGAVAQPGYPHISCNGHGSHQQTHCQEKEHLSHCSEDDYCTLGGSSNSSATGQLPHLYKERMERGSL